jgi:hypothetical protein
MASRIAEYTGELVYYVGEKISLLVMGFTILAVRVALYFLLGFLLIMASEYLYLNLKHRFIAFF